MFPPNSNTSAKLPTQTHLHSRMCNESFAQQPYTNYTAWYTSPTREPGQDAYFGCYEYTHVTIGKEWLGQERKKKNLLPSGVELRHSDWKCSPLRTELQLPDLKLVFQIPSKYTSSSFSPGLCVSTILYLLSIHQVDLEILMLHVKGTTLCSSSRPGFIIKHCIYTHYLTSVHIHQKIYDPIIPHMQVCERLYSAPYSSLY